MISSLLKISSNTGDPNTNSIPGDWCLEVGGGLGAIAQSEDDVKTRVIY